MFAEVVQDPAASPTLKSTNAALLAAAEGDWEKSTNILRGLVNADEDNFVVRASVSTVWFPVVVSSRLVLIDLTFDRP